jgi:hypothetical protein
VSHGFKPIAPPEPFGRYYMLSHGQDEPNPNRLVLEISGCLFGINFFFF